MRAFVPLLVAGLAGCSVGPPSPVAIDTANDTCAECRMIVSNPRLGAQIVEPGEEPLVFDDLGCLRDYLSRHPHNAESIVFVADHRTGAWVPSTIALYTKAAESLSLMGSGLIAHADAQSRDSDPAAAGGHPVDAAAILGARTMREADK